MKKTLLLIFLFCTINGFTQTPSFVVDATSFNALTLEGGQTEVQFADINNDGHLDLLLIGDHGSPIINSNQHGISVFFGNGTGTGWTLSQTGDFGYGGIAVGDVNNDGFLDVGYGMHHNYSTTDFGDQLLEVALGDGSGTNWTPYDDSLATAGETWGMFGTDFGDFNNDGLLDIVSGAFGCCAGTHVYLNKGTGAWQHSYGYINGNTEHYVECGDLNHDGNLDFVSCHQNGAPYFGDGTGNFSNMHNNLPSLSIGLGFYDVALDDIDHDGDADFGFIHNNSTPRVYKWNDSNQQWENNSTGLTVTGLASCIKLADVNNDGFSDAIVATTGKIEIFQGNGGSLWIPVISIPIMGMTFCQDINVADVDHNGFADIVFVAQFPNGIFGTINKFTLLRNNTITTTLNITNQFPSGYECFPNQAVRNIKWLSSVPAGNNASVQIDFSSAGVAGPWTSIATAAPNNGNFQWTVPTSVSSNNCYIRLIVTDSVTMLSDTSFNLNSFQVGLCDPTLSLSETALLSNLNVFPNPFTTQLNLRSETAFIAIEITNLVGQQVYCKQFDAPIHQYNNIETGLLPSGVYLVKTKTTNGNTNNIKVAKF